MKRLVRGLAVAAAMVGGSLLSVSASSLNTPTISGLNQYVVPGGFALVISGNHFADDATGKCDTGGGAPTVHFMPMAGGNDQTVVPDAGHCSNTQVTVAVPPAVSGAARVVLTDTNGHSTAQAPQVTIQPTASLSHSAGEVGSGADPVVGNNLLPPNAVPGSSPQLTLDGIGTGYSGLSDNGLTFTPGDRTINDIRLILQVCDNGDDNCGKRDAINIDLGSYTFNPPSLDPVNLVHQVVGSRLDLPGHYLGNSGVVTFSGGARGQGVQWSSGSVSVTVPPGAQSGPIVADASGYPHDLSGPTVTLDPRLTGVSPNAASANQSVHVSGFNFGGTGSVSLGGTAQSIASWGDQGVTFTLSDTDGGEAILTRGTPDGATVDLGNLAVVPHLVRTETNNVPAGAQVVVDGLSLGAGQGTARLGGADATPLLWSRSSVLLQLPTVIAPGTYPLVVTSAAGTASNALNLTIVAGASPSPGATHNGQPVGAGGAVAPSFDNNHDFVKPIKPPSPVYFNVTVGPHKVKAGDTADITVTLKLNDQPLKGAAVKVAMLFTPGDDFKFTPDSGVTDENGVFTAKVKTSKNPGDSVIAATSGVFSDQDHVLGTGSDGKVVTVTQGSPTPNGGFAPLLVLGVLAVGLVAAGFYLNVRSMGR